MTDTTLAQEASLAARAGDQSALAESPAGPRFLGGDVERVRVRAYYPPTRQLFDITRRVLSIAWTESSDQIAISGSLEIDNRDGRMGNFMHRPGMIVFVETAAAHRKMRERYRFVVWVSEATDLRQGRISLSLFDHMIYLTTATRAWRFKDRKCHGIAADVCRDLRIPVKSLVKGEHEIKLLHYHSATGYDTIAKAYKVESVKGDKTFIIRAEQGRIRVLRQRRHHMIIALDERHNLRSGSFTRSLGEGLAKAVVPRGSVEGSDGKHHRHDKEDADSDSGGKKAASVKRTRTGGHVYVIGDSLGVGSDAHLKSNLGSKWHVTSDTAVGRTTAQGITIMDGATLAGVIVVELGTNDSSDASDFRDKVNQVMTIAGAKRFVVWVNISRSGYGDLNDVLDKEAAKRENLVIVDWAKMVSSGQVDLPGGGVHPDPAGYKKRADAIAAAVRGRGGSSAAKEQRLLASSMLFGHTVYRPAAGVVKDRDYTRAAAKALSNELSRAQKELQLNAKGNILLRRGDRFFVRMTVAHGRPIRKEVYAVALTHTITRSDYVMDVTAAWRAKEIAATPITGEQGEANSGKDSSPSSGSDVASGKGVYDKAALKALAEGAGVADSNTAAAIALAESGGREDATNNNSNGSIDRGLWQINSVHGYDAAESLNAKGNAKEMAAISNGGTNWQPWVTYQTGAYKKYL